MENVDHSSINPKQSRRRRWEIKSEEFTENLYCDESKLKEKPKDNNPFLTNEKSIECDDNVSQASENISQKLDENKNVKKSKTIINDGCSTDLDLFNQTTQNSKPSAPPESLKHTKNTKKKVTNENSNSREKKNAKSKISEELDKMKGDIKKHKNETQNSSAFTISGLIEPSSGNNEMYCERVNNFVKTNQDKTEIIKTNLSKRDTRQSFALSLQKGFCSFAVVCQGLLAGISVAHCLMIYLLGEDIEVLFKNSIEHSFFALIMFLTSICLVSSCDRCDIGGSGVFSERGLRMPWCPLLYAVSAVLSLVAVKAEDMIVHFHLYSLQVQNKRADFLAWWKLMCAFRTLLCLCAFGASAVQPHVDALRLALRRLPRR